MGQGVSAAAAFGTKVRTTVSVEFQTQGIGAPPSPVDQMTGGAICARLRAPRTIFDDAADIQTQGGVDPYDHCQMTGGAICAQMRAPHTTDDLDDLPQLRGAGARVFPIAPRPDFFGGNL